MAEEQKNIHAGQEQEEKLDKIKVPKACPYWFCAISWFFPT